MWGVLLDRVIVVFFRPPYDHTELVSVCECGVSNGAYMLIGYEKQKALTDLPETEIVGAPTTTGRLVPFSRFLLEVLDSADNLARGMAVNPLSLGGACLSSFMNKDAAGRPVVVISQEAISKASASLATNKIYIKPVQLATYHWLWYAIGRKYSDIYAIRKKHEWHFYF